MSKKNGRVAEEKFLSYYEGEELIEMFPVRLIPVGKLTREEYVKDLYENHDLTGRQAHAVADMLDKHFGGKLFRGDK